MSWIRLVSCRRMYAMAVSSSALVLTALVNGISCSVHSFRLLFRCRCSALATAESHWLHARSHAATSGRISFACAHPSALDRSVSGDSKRLVKLLVLESTCVPKLCSSLFGSNILSAVLVVAVLCSSCTGFCTTAPTAIVNQWLPGRAEDCVFIIQALQRCCFFGIGAAISDTKCGRPVRK